MNIGHSAMERYRLNLKRGGAKKLFGVGYTFISYIFGYGFARFPFENSGKVNVADVELGRQ